MDKKILFILIGFFVFVVAINLLTRQYVAKLEVPNDPQLVIGGVKVEATSSSVDRSRQPDDPAAFGIVIMKDQQTDLSTQKDWDVFMRKVISDGKVFETDEGKNALDQLKMNPAQYKESMTRLESEIVRIEDLSRKSPADKYLRMRKQTLYKMKALTSIMEEKGVVDPNAASLPDFRDK